MYILNKIEYIERIIIFPHSPGININMERVEKQEVLLMYFVNIPIYRVFSNCGEKICKELRFGKKNRLGIAMFLRYMMLIFSESHFLY